MRVRLLEDGNLVLSSGDVISFRVEMDVGRRRCDDLTISELSRLCLRKQTRKSSFWNGGLKKSKIITR